MTSLRDRRSGQMLIFVSLSLSTLMAMIGLAVDLGYSYYVKTQTQAAADSAAQAAAIYAKNNGYVCGTNITCGTTYSCASPAVAPNGASAAFEAGCLYAQTNGFSNTGNQSVSFIANSTTTPNESTNQPSLWIQANVAQTVSHLFLWGSGFQSGSVASQAIAGITMVPDAGCLYVLSSSATQALSITGTSAVTASSCGVYVNSADTTAALYVTGSSTLTATGGAINVVGTPDITCGASCVSPSPTAFTGVTDPLASLAAPTVSSTCPVANNNYSLGNSNTATIDPGLYCGGITVSGSAVLTLHAGLYIMNGGGFNNTHGGTINTVAYNGLDGVTIYLTGQHGQTAAGMQLIGNSVTTLHASTSGTYQGILFYQDRSATYATTNTLSNSATLNATGTLYFKTTALSLTGNVATGKLAIVANTLALTGSSTFVHDSDGTYTGMLSPSPGLLQ